MKNPLLVIAGSLALILPGSLHAQTFAVTGVISETVGGTATIPPGGTAVTDTWNVGTVGEFALNGGAYYLRVSATNPTGTLSAGTDSLMVARTVNSQGLTDQGTLSVYVNTTTGQWSLDLTFEFFSNASFTTAAPVNLLLTSLDIDFNQRYYTRTTDFDQVTLYANTQITTATAISGYNGYTASGDSTFNNPQFAVSSFNTVARSSFGVKIAHNTSQALYMFEFRDPSNIVPEPATAALAGLGGLWLLLHRRRRTV